MHQITATVVLLCLVVQGIAATFFGSDDIIAELKLVGGSNRCEGRLEIRPPDSSLFGQASDNDVGTNEATVICRQLNCGTDGARTADATTFGFSSSVNVFRGFGYVCQGDETTITSCRRTGAFVTDTAANAIAIDCSGTDAVDTTTEAGTDDVDTTTAADSGLNNTYIITSVLTFVSIGIVCLVIAIPLYCYRKHCKRVNPTEPPLYDYVASYNANYDVPDEFVTVSVDSNGNQVVTARQDNSNSDSAHSQDIGGIAMIRNKSYEPGTDLLQCNSNIAYVSNVASAHEIGNSMNSSYNYEQVSTSDVNNRIDMREGEDHSHEVIVNTISPDSGRTSAQTESPERTAFLSGTVSKVNTQENISYVSTANIVCPANLAYNIVNIATAPEIKTDENVAYGLGEHTGAGTSCSSEAEEQF